MSVYTSTNLLFITLFTTLVPRWLTPPFAYLTALIFYCCTGSQRRGIRANLRVVLGRQHVERVVLITHEDCQSYRASAHLLGGLGQLLARQRGHLLALAKYLRERYLQGATFELYHARLVPRGEGKGVQFERIAADL